MIRPIQTARFGELMQLDLVDMNSHGHETFKYIMTLRDHASGFVFLACLSKTIVLIKICLIGSRIAFLRSEQVVRRSAG